MSDLKLQKLFQRRLVMDIQTIQKLCKNRSRRSLFRDMTKLGYISSYSHAGKFYTLRTIPNFDQHGLWHYEGISFSKHDTLKSTIQMLVSESSAGLTHKELRELLHVRVQNTLNDLLSDHAITRESVENLYLYLSSNQKISSVQVEHRRKQFEDTRRIPPLDPNTIIEVLLELLCSEDWQPKTICEGLKVRDIIVSEIQVKNIFSHYKIKKKTSI
jgi:hypothetical protein